jgi:hypothetical protein
MNTPGLRHDLRLAANVLAKNRKVCAQARESGEDAHIYNADRLEELSEACLAGAVSEYLRAVAGGFRVRELGKL